MPKGRRGRQASYHPNRWACKPESHPDLGLNLTLTLALNLTLNLAVNLILTSSGTHTSTLKSRDLQLYERTRGEA